MDLTVKNRKRGAKPNASGLKAQQTAFQESAVNTVKRPQMQAILDRAAIRPDQTGASR